jgi:hypothetical protein
MACQIFTVRPGTDMDKFGRRPKNNWGNLVRENKRTMSTAVAEIYNVPQQINLGFLPSGSEATEVALKLPKKMKYEDWESAIHQLIAAGASSSWLIGDGLAQGESWFGEDYAQAFDPEKLKRIDVDTLRNYQWVSENVAVVRRRTNLSWSHHQEIAAMKPNEQEYWLNLAELNKWSRNELRREVKRDRDTKPELEKELALLQDPVVRKWIEDYRDSLKARLEFVPEGAPFLHNMIHGQIGQAQWQLDRTASEESERVLDAIDEGWQIGTEIFNWLQKRSYFMREPELRARLIWMCEQDRPREKRLREVKQGGRKDNQRGDLTSMYVKYGSNTGDAFIVAKGSNLYDSGEKD